MLVEQAAELVKPGTRADPNQPRRGIHMVKSGEIVERQERAVGQNVVAEGMPGPDDPHPFAATRRIGDEPRHLVNGCRS
ncbi:hypothetical protein nbrc107696_30820 [Gordonia spumicola]|uniref:Uncharacterized protein n=1 Tax=Gordonia spumicola TaxID=589161 RepID=A0A7I9VB87_9ACTN|nr:hypothetical protein nbrc107696_30820 [Gordonia spumicola]